MSKPPPVQVQCSFFYGPVTCLRGDVCFFRHGDADKRATCKSCRKHRCPTGKNYCRACHLTYVHRFSKEQRERAKERKMKCWACHVGMFMGAEGCTHCDRSAFVGRAAKPLSAPAPASRAQ
jgi:hypothetical protein